MPRQLRLDTPGSLRDVMVRGLERRAIFRDDTDRTAFVSRVATLAEAWAWTVYLLALLPKNAHLLVRTGTRPLDRSMWSLLTGCAGAFDRQHKRAGHLFQNRCKSIAMEEKPYLLERVRHLHLNPLHAKVVSDLSVLERYPRTGHSALLGTLPRPRQGSQTILAQFGATRRRGRKAPQRGEQILGGSEFVEQVRQPVAAALGLSHLAVYAAATRGEHTAARRQAAEAVAVIANVPSRVPSRAWTSAGSARL